MEDKSRQTELFARARRGDVDAMNQLITCARSCLIDHARRTTLDNDLAEDAVQETLLAVQTEFAGLNGIEHFWGWLHTTLNHKILKEIRRSSRKRATFDLADVEGEIASGNSCDTLGDVVTGELKRAVANAMDGLSPWQRAVLSLRCYESLSFAEIAKRLGWTAITARIRFCWARLALALGTYGVRKDLLLVALGQFGTLTASTKAAAASVYGLPSDDGAVAVCEPEKASEIKSPEVDQAGAVFGRIEEELKGLVEGDWDTSRVLYHLMELQAFMGKLEQMARLWDWRYESRVAASLRDVCELHEPSKITEQQIRCLGEAINGLRNHWGKLTREEARELRSRLLAAGLTWIPVTDKAKMDTTHGMEGGEEHGEGAIS